MNLAKITARASFLHSISYFLGNFQMEFMINYGRFKISETAISVASITTHASFSGPVSNFFGNFKMELMVFYGCFKISKVVIGIS